MPEPEITKLQVSTEYMPPKHEVVPLIKNFIQSTTLNKTTAQSDEEQEQGLWLIEAAANYTFDDQPLSDYELEYEAYTFSVDAYNDSITGVRMLDGASLSNSYNGLSTYLQNIVDNMGNNEGILVIDVEVSEEFLTTTEMEVQIAKATAYNPFSPFIQVDDDWEAWGYFDGISWIEGSKCDGTLPNFGGAPRRLTDLVNINYPKSNAHFYTNVQFIILGEFNQSSYISPISNTNYTNWLFGAPGVPSVSSSIPSRECFNNIGTSGVYCINDVLLSQEYSNINYLINVEKPTNKEFINVLVNWSFMLTQGGFNNGSHSVSIYYGVPQLNPTNKK